MQKKTIIYWVLQVLGWGVFTGLTVFFSFWYQADNPHLWRVNGLNITVGLTGLLATHAMRMIIKKNRWYDIPFKQIILRVILLTLSAAIISEVIIHLVLLTILDWESYRPIIWKHFPFYTFNVFQLFLVWAGLYFAYHYLEQSRQTKLDKLKAEHAAKEAELIALKAQINPHFLFNALNNIRAMVLEDPMKSRDMISNLSDLLRYSIRFNNKEVVPLMDEVAIVQDYLNLESVQYENRLEYTLEISPETLERKIPPMLIQLLVENAVKHGISQLKDGGSINISTQLEQEDLIIKVENTGQLSDKGTNGIGIRNALSRIRLLFSIEPFFDLSEKDGKVLATIKLPAAR